MDNISIFKAERDSGLEERIKSESSIAYFTPVQQFVDDGSNTEVLEGYLSTFFDGSSKANKDDPDLYPTLSVLVSTVWNKNDDVFTKEEVWIAKETPEHKPTNIEHNDDKIVGHIVGNWPVDSEYNKLPITSTIDELPDVFHLITASVIYKNRQNPDVKMEVDELIAQIEAGEKFVSMECMFRGFDYAVRSPDDQNYVLPRTAETAFLTSHLRAYGGPGEYDGHRIGRMLKRITFIGKGYVDKPANPDSIIFNKPDCMQFDKASSLNPFTEKNGVLISMKSNTDKEFINMADTNLTDQIGELKTEINELKSTNKSLSDQLAQSNVEKYKTQIDDMQSEIASLKEELSTAKNDLESVHTSLNETNDKLTEANELNVELTKTVDEAKAKELYTRRVAALMEGGLKKEDAEAKVKIFEALNDDQFSVVAETIISANNHTEAPNEDNSESTASESTEASNDSEDTEVLESAETNGEPDLSTSSEDGAEDEGLELVRAGLTDWVQTKVLHKDIQESK